MAKVFGFDTSTMRSSSQVRHKTNTWGTTISETNYVDELVITQDGYNNSSNVGHYSNGYFVIGLDTLSFDKRYNVSFKITNVVSNPLNASLSDIRISNPHGNYITNPVVAEDGKIIFKNYWYRKNTDNPDRCGIEVYNCGMSFTLSEFMITAVEDEDFTYEPYRGEEVEVSLEANLAHGSDLASYNDYWYTVSGKAYRYCELFDGEPLPVSFIITDKDPSLDITSTKVNFGVVRNTNRADDGYNWIIENGKISGRNTNGQNYPSENWGRPCNYLFCYPKDESTLDTIFQKYDITMVVNPFYNGYVDITKGELVLTHKLLKLIGYEKWDMTTSSLPDAPYRPNFMLTDGSRDVGYYAPISDKLKGINQWQPPLYNIVYNSNRRILIGVTGDLDTSDKVNEWIRSIGGIDVIYPLANPFHYPLSPETLKTLRGFNTVFSTTNDTIEVGYSEMSPINLLGIRRMMMNAQPYVFVDHIVGTGYKSRIDTGVPGDDDTLKFEGCFSCDTYTAWFAFFGNYTKSGDNFWRLAFTDSDVGSLSWVTNATNGFASRARQGSLVDFRVPFMIENLHAIYTVDEHVTEGTRTSKTSGTTNNTNIAIGSLNTTNDSGGYVKTTWYYFKIYQGETLIRDYKPCLRIADRKYGFFETLSKTFCPSIGTVDFSAN